MYVTYKQYIKLGYSAVDEAAFPRYGRLASLKVRERTFNRIDINNISKMNMCGICEIIDIYFNNDHKDRQQIASFSNSKYSEQYVVYEKMVKTLDEKINDVLKLFFTPEQLWRGAHAGRI